MDEPPDDRNEILTDKEIARVRADYAVVGAIGQEVGLALYRRMFAIDPTLRDLFADDMNAQAAHLMAALGSVVSSLEDPAAMALEVHALAERHVDYHVKPEHFVTVGEALIATLETGLGDEFTPHAKTAWLRAYTALSNAMIAAMGESGSGD